MINIREKTKHINWLYSPSVDAIGADEWAVDAAADESGVWAALQDAEAVAEFDDEAVDND